MEKARDEDELVAMPSKMPPPCEIPSPPASSAHKYRINLRDRVVRADFSKSSSRIDPLDEAYVLGLFERPDVTVIINGLANGLDPYLWSMRYLSERCGEMMYHNFRRFTRPGRNPREPFVPVSAREQAWSSMRLRDYVRYLDKRADATRSRAAAAAAAKSNQAPAAETGEASTATGRTDAGPEGLKPGVRDSGASLGAVSVCNGDGTGEGKMGVTGRGEALRQQEQRQQEKEEPSMQFTSYDGNLRTVELLRESVYLTDMDLTRYLPECANNLSREFKMDILPAGARCAMQHMPRESRTFMGPNLYITPPGSWTQFHQDGNGTVDSGHQCLVGRNRVIMLRRLDKEEDKRTALRILAGDAAAQGGHAACSDGDPPMWQVNGKKPPPPPAGAMVGVTVAAGVPVQRVTSASGFPTGAEAAAAAGGGDGLGAPPRHTRPLGLKVYDGAVEGQPVTAEEVAEAAAAAAEEEETDPLYRMPHADGATPPWPTDEVVEQLRELNFCPSVFTLEPGEFVHINKGRLHAFRKEEPLPHEDPGSVCVSVAWDWVFKGVTEEGCRGEMACALRCASDNRRFGAVSLAPVETCLLQVAKASLASFRARCRPQLGAVPYQASPSAAPPPPPAAELALRSETAAGLFPAPPGASAAADLAVEKKEPAGGGSAGGAGVVAVAHPRQATGQMGRLDGGQEKSGGARPTRSSPTRGVAAVADGSPFCSSATAVPKREPLQTQSRVRHFTREILFRLLALVPEETGETQLGTGVADALRAIHDTPGNGIPGNGSSLGVASNGSRNGSSIGKGSSSPAQMTARLDEGDEEIPRSAFPVMGGGGNSGKGKAATTTTTADDGMPRSPQESPIGGDPSAPSLPQEVPPVAASAMAGASAGAAGDEPLDEEAAATPPTTAAAPAATVVTTAPALTGLDSWISSPGGLDVFGGVEGAGNGSGMTQEAAMAAAVTAADEVLETVAPAAAAAEAAAVRMGGGAAAAAAAAAAARGAIVSARLATAASSAAVRRFAERSLNGRDGGDGGDGLAAGVAAGLGGGGGERDRGVLMALAPMLEELINRQRRDYGLQAASAAKRGSMPVLNPARPGKRKLGPAAAKERDAQIMAQMTKMMRPLTKAVEKVEVDTSVPTFLEKINPFSSEGESFNCASCKAEIFNAYMHCYGCETILSRDLTLCLACHAAGRFGYPAVDPWTGLTDSHHCPGIPEKTLEQREQKSRSQRIHGVYPASKCDCKEPSCRQCHLCVACACDCHERFQLRFRFEHPSSLENFVKKVRDTAGGTTTISQELPTDSAAASREGAVGGGASIAASAPDSCGLGRLVGGGREAVHQHGENGAEVVSPEERRGALAKAARTKAERDVCSVGHGRGAAGGSLRGSVPTVAEATGGDRKKAADAGSRRSRKIKVSGAVASKRAMGPFEEDKNSGGLAGGGSGGRGSSGGCRSGTRSGIPPPTASVANSALAGTAAAERAPPSSVLAGTEHSENGTGHAGASSAPPPAKKRKATAGVGNECGAAVAKVALRKMASGVAKAPTGGSGGQPRPRAEANANGGSGEN